MHEAKAREGLRRFCHPSLFDQFVRIFPADLGTESSVAPKELIDAITEGAPPGATQSALVVTTREVSRAWRLRALSEALRFDLDIKTAKAITTLADNGRVELERMANQAGLALRPAASHLLSGWMHDRIDRRAVDRWLEQFGHLGKFTWIGEAILGQVQLLGESSLADMLEQHDQGLATALCVNVDPRGPFKSAEVIANLLTKRCAEGRRIYRAPADAIETAGVAEAVLFEDGLWSGTEAVGIINSLLGQRKELKTPMLKDPALLKKVQLTLAYGVGTDYGQALVRRFLDDQDLPNVTVVAANTISVASEELLQKLASKTFDPAPLYKEGPDASLLRPHLFERLLSNGLDVSRLAEMRRFCEEVGRQLFVHYLKYKIEETQGRWSMWEDSKLDKAAIGYHGLALTHAFAHSVPKASLPLLWFGGSVTWNGRTTDWKPLFNNA